MALSSGHSRPSLKMPHSAHRVDCKALIMGVLSEVPGTKPVLAQVSLGPMVQAFSSSYNALVQSVDVIENQRLFHRIVPVAQDCLGSQMV